MLYQSNLNDVSKARKTLETRIQKIRAYYDANDPEVLQE